MKLEEFYASRDRLEEGGMQAIGKALAKQQSLRKIEVYQNGSKRGLKYLLDYLIVCKESIVSVNIDDNKSINRAIPELKRLISSCPHLHYLNISNLNMKRKYCQEVADSILEAISKGSKLEELMWDNDLSCSVSTAKCFLEKVASSQTPQLKKLSMAGVF
jgi:Ran GTPase-activating protein (RanGAP) involved in mRNA processing and transport